MEFAFVEPQAVAFGTFIYQQSGLGEGDDNFLHFFQTDWAFSTFFAGIWVDFEGMKEVFGFFVIAEEKLELAGIEPDAITCGTEVDFNFCKFESNHRIFADGTVHKREIKS